MVLYWNYCILEDLHAWVVLRGLFYLAHRRSWWPLQTDAVPVVFGAVRWAVIRQQGHHMSCGGQGSIPRPNPAAQRTAEQTEDNEEGVKKSYN